MDKLWAPWRISYINKTAARPKGCIFCAAAKKPNGNNQVVFKTKLSTVMLNIYPYNNGHLLISPKRHLNDPDLLNEEEVLDLFRAIKKAKSLLKKTVKPQGYNIGMNISRSSGAGIAGHIHIHLVPRWVGDTNFMPVVHNTKIISQSLKELIKLLKNADSRSNK
jgi:ATP adenylyltransferase